MSVCSVDTNAWEKSNFGRVLKHLAFRVDKLKEEMSELKESLEVVQKDKAEEKIATMEALMAKLAQLECLKERDWAVVTNSLDVVLDHSSAAYRQLRAIPFETASAMWEIGTKGCVELATALTAAGLCVNMSDGEGNTLLHGAAGGGHVKFAAVLLDRGANLEARNKYNNTPLITAAKENQLKMVMYLKEHGANVNAFGYRSWSSLHRVASNGNLKGVRYLVEAGAKTIAKDKNGRTPLALARSKKHDAVVRYLSKFPH